MAEADGSNEEAKGGSNCPLPHVGLGTRLREARQAANLGVRQLGRQLGLSASLISQIELGRVAPSVSTLYALTNALGVSMDSLFREQDGSALDRRWSKGADTRRSSVATAQELAFVQRRTSRRSIDLEQGVRWELLTPTPEPGAEFLEVVYPTGGSSSPTDHAVRHNGRDYCLILDGELSVQIGFEEHLLETGDSLAFDATLPHRFWNAGPVPVRAVWLVLERAGLRV